MQMKQQEKGYFAGIVLFGLLEALLIILQMRSISEIAAAVFVDHVAVAALHRQFLYLVVLMAGVVGCNRAGGWLADGLAFSVKDSIASQLLEKFDRLGGAHGSGTDSGRCLMLLTDGVERLEEFFARLLPQTIKTAMIPILFFCFVFPADWVSGVLLFVTVPIILLFMMLIGRFSKSASEKQWDVLQRISGYLHDAMVYLPWLKLWGKAEESAVKVEQLSNDFRVRTLKVMQIAFLSAFVLELFTMIGIALVAVTLGVRLVEGMVEFQTALFVILLAPEFYVPLRTLGGKYHDSIRAMSAFRDVTAFLNQEEAQRGAESLILTEAPEVALCQVGFHYPDSGFSLQEINLQLKAGTNTVIFGESGCGKSTLLGLVSGMKLAEQGSVTWNGVDVKTLSMETVRKQVGYIGQDSYIFSGSVYDNIALGDAAITKEMVEQACVKLGFDNMIASMEQGYDTQLGEDGRGLSGGQKRMLGMARIFVRNQYLVVCDEPLAGLDYRSERMVYRAMEALMEGRTALLVSHREEIVNLADQVYWMEDGVLRQG